MEEWIGQREFARRKGVTHTAVQKAIRDKRIPEASVRRKGDRIVGVEYHTALAAWDASTDPAAAAKNELPGGSRHDETASAGAARELPLTPKDPSGYQASRAKREGFTAALAELDYNKAIGRVVDIEEIEEAQRRLFRVTRDKFLNIADRITPVVTAERDPARVHAAIKKEIEQVLNELSDDARAEATGGTAERVAA